MVPVRAMASAAPFDPHSIDLDAFMADLAALRREIDESLGQEELEHLKKLERWGRACTVLGLLGCGFAPNPISAALLSGGRIVRFAMLHHIAHRGYDRVPGVPERYTSKVFARGRRRYLDYLDWIVPEGWIYEHNVLHHSHVGEDRDPDLLERVSAPLRELPEPLRYAILGLFGLAWRPLQYGPSSLILWLERQTGRKSVDMAPDDFIRHAREIVRECFLPPLAVYFVALPLCYLPLGPWGVFSAFCNSAMAEIFMSLHLFFVFVPSHAGEDLHRWDSRPRSRGEHAVRQIIGTTNYTTGGDLRDLAQFWVNYQIEHHLFPDLPMRTYQKIQPRVRALCEAYGIPYTQESVVRRFKKMVDIMIGKATMVRVPAPAADEMPEVAAAE